MAMDWRLGNGGVQYLGRGCLVYKVNNTYLYGKELPALIP
jgi:hypothetical protein